MKLHFSVTSCVKVRWTASDSLLECGGPAPLWPQVRMRPPDVSQSYTKGRYSRETWAKALSSGPAPPWPEVRMRLTRCVTKLAQGALHSRDLGQSAARPAHS